MASLTLVLAVMARFTSDRAIINNNRQEETVLFIAASDLPLYRRKFIVINYYKTAETIYDWLSDFLMVFDW
jgi:hypothetical protein